MDSILRGGRVGLHFEGALLRLMGRLVVNVKLAYAGCDEWAQVRGDDAKIDGRYSPMISIFYV